MRLKQNLPASLLIAAASFLLAFSAFAAQTKHLKVEAYLIWATTADTSPNREHKPVEGELRKKLSELPLKWKNYFLVKKADEILPQKGSKDITLSDKCKVSIKDIDGKSLEVALIGKGEPVLKRTQKLPKGELLVLGGNAPDETGWLVVLKRIE